MELLYVHSLVSSPFPGGVFALSLLLEVLKLVVSFGGAACTPCFIVPLLHSSNRILHPPYSGTLLLYQPCISLGYGIALESVTAKLSEKMLRAGQDKFRQSRLDQPQSWGFCNFSTKLMACCLQWQYSNTGLQGNSTSCLYSMHRVF